MTALYQKCGDPMSLREFKDLQKAPGTVQEIESDIRYAYYEEWKHREKDICGHWHGRSCVMVKPGEEGYAAAQIGMVFIKVTK